MSESLITKKALAESIKQLMETTPLSKISIQMIVDNCGLNRTTFYYHFQDKFDLVNWIYYTEAIESIADYKSYDTWIDGIYRILLYLMNNKAFYINALNTPEQNGFDRYLFKVTHELIKNVLDHVADSLDVSEEDKNFISDFYNHAFVGITLQWAKNGMKESPERIVNILKDIVEGSMLRAVTRHAKR